MTEVETATSRETWTQERIDEVCTQLNVVLKYEHIQTSGTGGKVRCHAKRYEKNTADFTELTGHEATASSTDEAATAVLQKIVASRGIVLNPPTEIDDLKRRVDEQATQIDQLLALLKTNTATPPTATTPPATTPVVPEVARKVSMSRSEQVDTENIVREDFGVEIPDIHEPYPAEGIPETTPVLKPVEPKPMSQRARK
jgi:hypothetical protein